MNDSLVDLMASCSKDPLGFVLAAFPWGEKGTELEKQTGPRKWQREVLEEIGRQLQAGESLQSAVRIAVASGHGIGKSALVAFIVLWALCTREDSRGVVTANTAAQLSTKTWPEISKWYRMLICRSWFDMTATAITSVDPRHEKTWRVDAVTWSEENTESFAGLHNEGSRILLIMDEASSIADLVWEVAEGAMTDANTEILWICFGNPTRTDGRFRECFRKFAKWWWTRNIDSRTVEGTNKHQLDQWAEMYGVDSDWYKVRVRGLFPEQGEECLIPADVVNAAMARDAAHEPWDPVVMGVDVARYGKDWSVVWIRRGNDARSIPRRRFRELNTMELADQVSKLISTYDPDAVFIDETGVGGGVLDRLRQMGHEVVGVNFAHKPPGTADGILVANMRAYMWVRGREWLRRSGSIPLETDLVEQFTGVGTTYTKASNHMLLTPKDELPVSPDDADALFLTLAGDVGLRRRFEEAHRNPPAKDYDPIWD